MELYSRDNNSRPDLRNFAYWNSMRVILKMSLDEIEQLLASGCIDKVNRKSYRTFEKLNNTAKGILMFTTRYLAVMKD